MGSPAKTLQKGPEVKITLEFKSQEDYLIIYLKSDLKKECKVHQIYLVVW